MKRFSLNDKIDFSTYSTSKKGNVTVFQKSYPYSQVICDNNWISLLIKRDAVVASYLEMFIPFFFNQRTVLNCNCVPHVVFLKKVFSTN